MPFFGIHLPHKKGTAQSATVKLPLPEVVKIPMSQHMGTPCEPTVKVGDTVTVGQKIGDSTAFMSTPVHSSVSGTVKAIEDYLLASGKVCKAVVIETDGNQTVSEDVKPPQVDDLKSFVAAIKESGCCGLGGAGFPTHIKLNVDINDKPIDSLVINAAECEPYITSDCREIIERPDDVIDGIKQVMKYLEIEKAYICIEKNKPEAIKLMKEKTASEGNIKVVPLRASYPQGAEKVVAYSATGRIVGEGELPSAKGIIVLNVSTAGFISRYLKTGMPLVEKRLTLDGDAFRTPCNVMALVGTPVSKLIKFADGAEGAIAKLIAGGPMMGMCLYDFETPVTKTNNAILGFTEKLAVRKEEQTACIHCGRCVSACPMKLMPNEIAKAYEAKDADMLRKLKLNLCMNCGSCSYVCPARRNVAETNQLAKGLIR